MHLLSATRDHTTPEVPLSHFLIDCMKRSLYPGWPPPVLTHTSC